jgi:hypothetical protein
LDRLLDFPGAFCMSYGVGFELNPHGEVEHLTGYRISEGQMNPIGRFLAEMNSISRQAIYNFYARCGSGEINYVFCTVKRTHISRFKEL